MKNGIIKRNENGGQLLYEPPEPLFPPLQRGKIRLPVLKTAVALALAAAVCVCVVTLVSGAVASGGSGANSGNGEENGVGNNAGGAYTDNFGGAESEADTEGEVTEPSGAEGERESSRGDESDTEQSDVAAWGDSAVELERESVDITLTEKQFGDLINYTSEPIDVQGLIDRGFLYSEQAQRQAPLVMIIHTHTSEQYDGVSDAGGGVLSSVVSVGERITEVLNAHGIAAVHCTVINDGDGNAYVNARDTVITMLKIYPSVRYVIDVHRLELGDGDGATIKTRVTDGAAQIKLTVSADKKSYGTWREDVSLALAVREQLNGTGEAACAPVSVTHGGYNGDVCRFYLTAEIGAEGNSVSEAIAAGEKFAMAMIEVLVK